MKIRLWRPHKEKLKWHTTFAFLPKNIINNEWVWLERVQRRRFVKHNGMFRSYHYEYRPYYLPLKENQ